MGNFENANTLGAKFHEIVLQISLHNFLNSYHVITTRRLDYSEANMLHLWSKLHIEEEKGMQKKEFLTDIKSQCLTKNSNSKKLDTR